MTGRRGPGSATAARLCATPAELLVGLWALSQTTKGKHAAASLGLERISEDDWPAFERGLCEALTAEAPRLVQRLQAGLEGTEAMDSTEVWPAATDAAVSAFVRGYATRWGVWEGPAAKKALAKLTEVI